MTANLTAPHSVKDYSLVGPRSKEAVVTDVQGWVEVWALDLLLQIHELVR